MSFAPRRRGERAKTGSDQGVTILNPILAAMVRAFLTFVDPHRPVLHHRECESVRALAAGGLGPWRALQTNAHIAAHAPGARGGHEGDDAGGDPGAGALETARECAAIQQEPSASGSSRRLPESSTRPGRVQKDPAAMMLEAVRASPGRSSPLAVALIRTLRPLRCSPAAESRPNTKP